MGQKVEKRRPPSRLLGVQEERKRAEEQVKLLSNRLAHLEAAEEKARKKIEESQRRRHEIALLKRRHLEEQEAIYKDLAQKDDSRTRTKRAATARRANTRAQVRYSKKVILETKKAQAERQRESLKQLLEFNQAQREAVVVQNRQKYQRVRQNEQAAKERRQKEIAEKERKKKQLYQEKLRIEAERKEQAQQLAQDMEHKEKLLLQRLEDAKEAQLMMDEHQFVQASSSPLYFL